MSKISLTLLIIFLNNPKLLAQDQIKILDLTPARFKVSNSLYNRISFLDSREDSSLIGIVNVGFLKNQDAKLILKTPVQSQLANLLNSLIDSSAKDGELLFQLKDFRFVERMGTRYCYLNAALYLKNENLYQKLSSLDTVILVTASDVTKILMNEGNKIICNFLATTLLQQSVDTFTYRYNDLKNIDSIEKRQIPVYNTTQYTDGIYYNYTSFKNQAPDKQGIVDLGRNGIISSVKILDSNGKKIKIKSKSIYAVVHKGRLFIATEYGFYPMERIRDNLFFTGDVKVASSTGDIRTAQVGLGLIGAALASSGYEAKYDMIIDYQNGRFIHLLAIKVESD